MKTMTPQQKLQLADDIEQRIAERYPRDQYGGQPADAVAIVLLALTDIGFMRELFGGK